MIHVFDRLLGIDNTISRATTASPRIHATKVVPSDLKYPSHESLSKFKEIRKSLQSIHSTTEARESVVPNKSTMEYSSEQTSSEHERILAPPSVPTTHAPTILSEQTRSTHQTASNIQRLHDEDLAEKMTSKLFVRVLWDLENISVSKKLGGLAAVKKLHEFLHEKGLYAQGVDFRISAFFNPETSCVSSQTVTELDKAGVELVWVSPKREDADRKIGHRISQEVQVLKDVKNTVFVVISSDQDFRHHTTLLQSAGYRVIIIHNASQGIWAKTLEMHSTETYRWQEDIIREKTPPRTRKNRRNHRLKEATPLMNDEEDDDDEPPLPYLDRSSPLPAPAPVPEAKSAPSVEQLTTEASELNEETDFSPLLHRHEAVDDQKSISASSEGETRDTDDGAVKEIDSHEPAIPSTSSDPSEFIDEKIAFQSSAASAEDDVEVKIKIPPRMMPTATQSKQKQRTVKFSSEPRRDELDLSNMTFAVRISTCLDLFNFHGKFLRRK